MEKITLRQIEVALAVETAGSICLAAKHLRLAQPSLSQQIAALEGEVGVKLFDRLPGGTFPTPSGQAFLDKVRHLSGEVESARLASLAAVAVERPEVSIGLRHMEHAPRVVAAIGALRAQHTDLHASVHDFASDELLRRALQSGAIDLAFGVGFETWPGPLTFVFETRYMVLVPRSHPLADREEVTPHDLEGEPWVQSPALARLDTLGVDLGVPLEPVSTASSAEGAEAMVAAGLGLTLVASDRNIDDRLLCRVRLVPTPTERVWAASQRDFDPFQRALVSAASSGP